MNRHESGRGIGTNGNNGTGSMLTMREACTLLNVHGNTLRRWSSMGVVRAYRIGAGQQRRFKVEDIAALVVEQTKFPADDNGRF